MAADVTSIQAALNETWTEKRIAEQLYQGNPVLQRIKRLNKTEYGEYAQTSIHTERNWGFTVTGSTSGTLNPAGQQGYAQAKWYYTHQHAQIKIEGSAIDQTAGSALALASVIDEEVNGAVNDISRQLSRQLCMNQTGIIATTQANSAVTDVKLQVPSGLNALDRGWLARGAVVNIGVAANVDSKVAAGVVTATSTTDPANPTITFASAQTTSAGDRVALLGSTVDSAAALEMNGLVNVVSGSDIGGVSVATTPDYQSNVDATSQALSLALMYNRNRKIAQKTGKPATFVATSLKQQQAAYVLAQANVRYMKESDTPVGHVDAVSINGVDLFAVPDVQDEHMFFLTIEDLLLVTNGDPYWQNKVTGGDKLAWIQGTDSYGGKITTRCQLGARRRNSSSALTGLT